MLTKTKRLVTVLLAALVVATCAAPVAAAPKYSLKMRKSATITVGQTLKLNPKITPKKTKVKWKSTNKKVATVNGKGVVKGKKAGKTVIQATLPNKKVVKCKITVKKKAATAMSVTSSGINSKGYIADKYGKRGSTTTSLPLTIKNAPAGTKYYAVMMMDPDSKPLVGYEWRHWMAANFTMATLPENASVMQQGEMQQGMNDNGTKGYVGPQPPDKTHTYVITVYALSDKATLPPNFDLSAKEFEAALSSKVLAKVTLTGKYDA